MRYEKKIKYLIDQHMAGAWGEEPYEGNSVVCLRAADIETERLTHKIVDLTRRSFKEDDIKNKQLKAGDIILEKSGGGENQPVGRVMLFSLNEPALCSNFLEILRPKKSLLFPRYGIYLFYSIWSSRKVIPSIKQTTGIQNLDISDYLDIKVEVPDLDEQQKIADYLDKETSRIDAMIVAKENLLRLLEEKKQSLITKAVTKGFDPNAKMKDSGINWLGKVPDHWILKRLKYVVRKIDEPIAFADFIVAVENIESKTGKLVSITEQNKYEGSLSKFEAGDVIFNKLRPYLAKVFLAEGEGASVGELLILRPGKDLVSTFLFFRLISSDFIAEVDSSTVGAKMPRANWDSFIKEQVIAIPPLKEQILISNVLKEQTAQLDKLRNYTEISINLLKQRRNVLITNSVIGKVKFES
jgi:restriction endonuclease S subunit